MMTVLSCVTGQHNLWLVALAAIVCVAGSAATIKLLYRAAMTRGQQKISWHFLTGVAAGATIWCTHFIAILAYNPTVPVTFLPVLTIFSLLIAIFGSGAGFYLATRTISRWQPSIGGAIVGLAIVAMHYTGMMAYRIQGIITWDTSYVAVSVALAVTFAGLATHAALRAKWRHADAVAVAYLVAAIVSLHFTAMTAVSVTPLDIDGAGFSQHALYAMAFAVAGVGMVIIGTGLSSYFIDDRTRSEVHRRLEHMALHDALTGLPNRSNFSNRLAFELDCAKDSHKKVAVVAINLDRFKTINDLRGHHAGDEALKMLARRMSGLQQPGELLARIGGDEFAAMKSYTETADLMEFINRLRESLFEPVPIATAQLSMSASMGVVVYPDDAQQVHVLLNNADLAMHRAKRSATESVCFYDSVMDEQVRARRNLATDLRDAIRHKQLTLHYQIQTSVSTNEPIGYEALLRWHHPDRGPVSPAEFIPIAEETGLIIEIGEWVLRTACKDAVAWPQQVKVAVNLSPMQFAHSDLPHLVHQILLETGLPPHRLELELTESAIIDNKDLTLHALRRIKALGVSVALDDFGTGYSSLETLRSFPFDRIKLDRSFLTEIESSAQAKAIFRAVLTLGKNLEIPVLAEGIETQSQLYILKVEGCDAAQGFYIGRPAPIALGDDSPMRRLA